jgi:hypothetical protein
LALKTDIGSEESVFLPNRLPVTRKIYKRPLANVSFTARRKLYLAWLTITFKPGQDVCTAARHG